MEWKHKQPCDSCIHFNNNKCSAYSGCLKYKIWFAKEWEEIQKLFGVKK